MKKSIVIIGSIFILAITTVSCGGQKAMDIDVNELGDACEFVDALGMVVDEMSVLVADGELKPDEQEEFDKLTEKGNEISDVAQSKHPRSTAEDCPNWDSFRKKSENLEGYK